MTAENNHSSRFDAGIAVPASGDSSGGNPDRRDVAEEIARALLQRFGATQDMRLWDNPSVDQLALFFADYALERGVDVETWGRP